MEEQDDSENSTIYITGLTENATLEEMAEFFKHSGVIRVRLRLHALDTYASHLRRYLDRYYGLTA